VLTHACHGSAVCPTSLTRHAGHLTYPKQGGQYKEQQQQKCSRKRTGFQAQIRHLFFLSDSGLDRIRLSYQKPVESGLKTLTFVLNFLD
jgi:hypothetical protein